MSDTPKVNVLSVATRFRGPTTSGNGGYVAGLLAEQLCTLGEALEVTLRRPPPLERALRIERLQIEAQLLDGDALIAQAQRVVLALEVPAAPSFAQAEAASRAFPGFHHHVFPECFSCGPARAAGDGLRVFPGRISAAVDAPVAAPFLPAASLATPDGKLPIAVTWAALDCSGYFAAAHPAHALLGKICAEVSLQLTAAEPYVVLGWSLGREGRKIHAGTAIFDAHGVLHARAKQTWIAIS